MDALEIEDKDSLQSWLEDKPVEWAQLIAFRAALRVFPLVLKGGSIGSRRQLALTVWRCLFIASVARKYSTIRISTAASLAQKSATAFAQQTKRTAVAIAIADAAGSAAATFALSQHGLVSMYAARCVSSSFAAAYHGMAWQAMVRDCAMLVRDGLEALETAHLWFEGEDRTVKENKSIFTTPRRVETQMARLPGALDDLLGPDARLMADWFYAMHSGDMGTNWTRVFLGNRARKLALKTDAFWNITDERDAETIMEDIAVELEWDKSYRWDIDPNEGEGGSFIFLSHARTDRPNPRRCGRCFWGQVYRSGGTMTLRAVMVGVIVLRNALKIRQLC